MEPNNLWTFVNGLLDTGKTSLPEEVTANPVDTRSWSNRMAKKEAKAYTESPDPFESSWGRVLKAEGGYVNNPDDPGGETKYGISKRSYPHLDIPNLTPEDAKAIYKSDYYDATGANVIGKINPGLAEHIADMGFNAGPRRAVELLYETVGLPRQGTITDELINRIDSEQDIIKQYSATRLRYYSSLANAPTFIKGWTNRVNNLNKAIGITEGMNYMYKAAKGGDVDTLNNTAARFVKASQAVLPMLTEEDKQSLRNSNAALSPLYSSKASKGLTAAEINDKKLSSIGEVFKATYDQKYYLNTNTGLKELVNRSIMEASEANRKALGDKFDKGVVEKLTFGLYGGVRSLEDFNEEVAKFKEKHPDVKLPFESANQVYHLAHQKGEEIERRYGELESGEFSGGVGSALTKLGHVVAGYLPGQMVGAMSDPVELAVNAIPLGKGVAIAKGAAAAFLGTAATQVGVQSKRQDLGLPGGFAAGLVESTAAAGGQAAFGVAAAAMRKLFSLGSKATGEAAEVVAKDLVKSLEGTAPNMDTAYASKFAEEIVDIAQDYKANPYGDDVLAKQTLDLNLANIAKDLSEGRPPRMIDAPMVQIPERVGKVEPELAGAYKEWDAFKKQYLDDPEKLAQIDPKAAPVYGEDVFKEAHVERVASVKKSLEIADADLDKSYTATLDRVNTLAPEKVRDSLAGDAEFKGMLDELKIDKEALPEFFNCMFGEPDVNT